MRHIHLSECDKSVCLSKLATKLKTAGYSEAAIAEPSQSKPCATATCLAGALYGAFRNATDPLIIASGDLTCTGLGQWKDAAGRRFDFPACKDDPCSALTSGSMTRCLDHETCQDVPLIEKALSCSAPYTLWYGKGSSWVWEMAASSLLCKQGAWYDGEKVVDKDFSIACKTEKCTTCDSLPPASDCIGGCAAEKPGLTSESPYSCKQISCSSGVFAINGGIEYIGSISCDKHKKWLTSTGLAVNSVSCLATSSLACKPLAVSTKEDCASGSQLCAQADLFNSNYFCDDPYGLWLEVEPAASEFSDRYIQIVNNGGKTVQCVNKQWFVVPGGQEPIADGSKIHCGAQASLMCPSPTNAAPGFSIPQVMYTSYNGIEFLHLECAPPNGEQFFLNGEGDADRYDGPVVCQAGRWLNGDGTEVLAASCITKSSLCPALLTYKNGNEHCGSDFCYPLEPVNGRYSCDDIEMRDGPRKFAVGAANESSTWPQAEAKRYLACGANGKWYNFADELTPDKNAVQCESDGACPNPPPFVSVDQSACGGSPCNISPVYTRGPPKELKCRMVGAVQNTFWVMKEGNATPQKVTGKILCNALEGKYYHGADVVQHVSCAFES